MMNQWISSVQYWNGRTRKAYRHPPGQRIDIDETEDHRVDTEATSSKMPILADPVLDRIRMRDLWSVDRPRKTLQER